MQSTPLKIWTVLKNVKNIGFLIQLDFNTYFKATNQDSVLLV